MLRFHIFSLFFSATIFILGFIFTQKITGWHLFRSTCQPNTMLTVGIKMLTMIYEISFPKSLYIKKSNSVVAVAINVFVFSLWPKIGLQSNDRNLFYLCLYQCPSLTMFSVSEALSLQKNQNQAFYEWVWAKLLSCRISKPEAAPKTSIDLWNPQN